MLAVIADCSTRDAAGWTITFRGRPPLPMKVTVSGDAAKTSAGSYERVRREGVTGTTEVAVRIATHTRSV